MIQRRTPLPRSKAPLKRSSVKQKRAKPRRVSVDRNPDYLEWLRERRCITCVLLHMIYRDRLCASGAGPIDAAHGPVNGRSSKGPDSGAIPLCRAHHAEQHTTGWAAFESKYGFSREKEAAAHFALWQATLD